MSVMPPERPLAVAKLATRWLLQGLLLWLATTAPEVRSACPSMCECRWKGGKDTTECVDRGLSAIPPGIDTATQVLDMTGNGLQSLPKEIFLRNGLTNLQKIFLVNCKLAQIDALAFSRLKNLVELDLSNNLVTGIPTDSFRGLGELRRLVLSGNPIGVIAAGAFSPLGSLIVLELSNCRLETVDPGAFGGLPGLQQLKLNGNRLRALAADVLRDIGSLHGIRLEENPWTCDCHCRDFRRWLTASNVPRTVAPQCGEPPRLRGFDVDKLILEDFACAPYGLGPAPGVLRAPLGGNVSLQCDITSDPEAFVHWLWQDTVITNATGMILENPDDGGRTYLVEETSGSDRKSSILTLEALEERDAGLYVCVAENRGGRYLVNFTLRVEMPAARGPGAAPPEVASKGVLLGAIIGLGVFALAALVLVCVLVARCCHASHRRRRHRRHKIPRSETQETKGSSTYDSQNDPLNDKRDLQPAPNPIQKPPRSFAANATYVSTSEISLHDYGTHQSSERLMGGTGGAGGAEPQNGGVYSIRPDIIKMDNGEYSVPRGALVSLASPVTNGGAPVPVDNNAIYQNTGRWSNESPIATCHGCGDHSGSCLGVPCLQGYGHGAPEVDAESDRSYRAANFRPTASGIAGELSDYDAEEWPRPPPPLYDTVKQPIPVQDAWDDQYETVGYPAGSGSGQVWERQSPMAATGVATIADSFPGSSKQFAAGAAPGGAAAKHPNVHLKNSVSGLSPFPILNLSTVRDSPDEGYEDEGEEGTEV